MVDDSRSPPLKSRFTDIAQFIADNASFFARDAVAGVVTSIVLIANIISFGTLMFPGDLVVGVPTAIWSMLVGACIVGICVALTTSLPPLATGIDSPTGAVLIVLSVAVGSAVIARGGTAPSAVATVMLIFTAATLFSGALFLAIGYFRWAEYFRFVPYFVVGGFLAATGWLLISGGVRMTTGHPLTIEALSAEWTGPEAIRLGCAVATVAILLTLRHLVRSVVTIPVALLAMWVAGAAILGWLDLSDVKHGWYFRSMGALNIWSPFNVAHAPDIPWQTLIAFIPEVIAVTLVALLSLVTKVSGMEVVRQTFGDLDREFRSHGIGNIIAAPFGGLISAMQSGTSRLLEQAGGTTRGSGVICSAIIGLVALGNFDLAGIIPIPVIAGLVFYLGYTFFMDALARPFAQRAWLDLLPAIGIAVVCVKYGYLFGVLVGLIGACLLFAISYARIGAVRRSITRAKFASNVDRSPEASEYLHVTGDAIQLYWLTGYIFFGCSEGVLERVRGDIEALPSGRVRYVVLDFGMVSGADSSALVSLSKLKSFCDQCHVTLVYCSLSPGNHTLLEKEGFFGGKSRHQAFANLNTALAWCEDQLLATTQINANIGLAGFEPWLQRQLGPGVNAADLIGYLERKNIDSAQVLYDRGGPANSIDLVAAGTLMVEISNPENATSRRRRITTHTVVGEMGFFRKSVRSATVSTDGSATIFTLTRTNFERMQQERPDLSSAFYNFIICVLADRIEFSNREVAALSV
ncbi:MAG TPA: SulP family inorganic anion transporter [Xanthobacteraceae bacterium]|nr:SulP family inorganic anion transporter [Xanthobacteraceae bacterium]